VRLVVFGAGAVGSLFAARLARAGHAVTLVGRSAHVEEVRAHGLVVEGSDPQTVSLEARTELAPRTDADRCVLTVKTFDLETAGRSIAERLDARRPILATENGLGIESTLARGLEAGGWPDAAALVVRTVHSIPVTWVGPGRVRLAGEGEMLFAQGGTASAEAAGSESEAFAALFESAGFRVRRVPDFDREVWRKALVNAAINPVTADHGIPNGRLSEDPWRDQALRLLAEARDVAEREGFAFPSEEAEGDLWRVVKATAQNRSSMLQDVERGRPTEIDAISGAILALGRRHGLSLPATRRAAERIRARAARAARAGADSPG
jgi:2-dehydropantoate 2-reductase